jgi:hypothetical protein
MNAYAIIITHFFSDWILQPRHAAENKTSNPLWMLAHTTIIWFCFAFASYVTTGIFIKTFMWYAVLNALWHFFIDNILWKLFAIYAGKKEEEYIKRNLWAKDYWFFFTVAVDQMLHLGIAFYLFNK